MNKEDIIRMAREAGFKPHHSPEMWDITIASDEAIERFAHLVYESVFRDANLAASRTILDAAVLEEREACAKLAEETGKEPDDHKSYEGYEEGYQDGSNNCAAAIRARSNP
jgi:hypothetical protein